MLLESYPLSCLCLDILANDIASFLVKENNHFTNFIIKMLTKSPPSIEKFLHLKKIIKVHPNIYKQEFGEQEKLVKYTKEVVRETETGIGNIRIKFNTLLINKDIYLSVKKDLAPKPKGDSFHDGGVANQNISPYLSYDSSAVLYEEDTLGIKTSCQIVPEYTLDQNYYEENSLDEMTSCQMVPEYALGQNYYYEESSPDNMASCQIGPEYTLGQNYDESKMLHDENLAYMIKPEGNYNYVSACTIS